MIASGQTFSRETTLSGNEILRTMQGAKEAGFRVNLFFVGVDSLETSRRRVEDRVSKGGHDIPRHVQERRFDRSFDNAARAARIADTTVFVHSREEQFQSVGMARRGSLHGALTCQVSDGWTVSPRAWYGRLHGAASIRRRPRSRRNLKAPLGWSAHISPNWNCPAAAPGQWPGADRRRRPLEFSHLGVEAGLIMRLASHRFQALLALSRHPVGRSVGLRVETVHPQ